MHSLGAQTQIRATQLRSQVPPHPRLCPSEERGAFHSHRAAAQTYTCQNIALGFPVKNKSAIKFEDFLSAVFCLSVCLLLYLLFLNYRYSWLSFYNGKNFYNLSKISLIVSEFFFTPKKTIPDLMFMKR